MKGRLSHLETQPSTPDFARPLVDLKQRLPTPLFVYISGWGIWGVEQNADSVRRKIEKDHQECIKNLSK